MLNAGVFGLVETIRPVISADRSTVKVTKTLVRPRSDAAVPPGQAVELVFRVAAIGFDIFIREWSINTIGTDDRRNGTLSAVSAGRSSEPINRSKRPELAMPRPIRAAAATAVARARLPFDDFRPPLDWELEPPDVFLPPDPLPDPQIPFKITLTPPTGEPRVWDRPRASALRDLPLQGGFPVPGAVERSLGTWKVSVENNNETAMRYEIAVRAVHSIRDLETKDIPLSLLNHVTATALKKVSPTISYREGQILVETPTHFLRLIGVEGPEFELPGLLATLVEEIPSFTPLLAVVESRERLVQRLRLRQSELNELLAPTAPPQSTEWNIQEARRRRVEAAMQESIDRVARLPDWDAEFCVVIDGMFASGSVELDYVGEVARIDNKLPQLALIFDRQFRLSEVVTNLVVDLSPGLVKGMAGIAALGIIGTAGLLALFGPVGAIIGVGVTVALEVKFYNAITDYDVQEKIRTSIRDKAELISEYARGIFERLSAVGAVGLDCELLVGAAADDSDVLRVSYYDPTAKRPPRPIVGRPDVAVGDGGKLPTLAMAMEAPGGTLRRLPRTGVTFRRHGDAVREHRHTLAQEAPGQLPASMIVRQPETLGRLDQHESIVVVMMENRSFDHMFFELSQRYPGRGYADPPATFTNPAPPGFTSDFGVASNRSIGIGNTLIFARPPHSADPSHSFENTMFQIGGGTEATRGSGQMLGFARDFALKSDSPQIVMSYHKLDDLPVFRTLADYYAVCDRWFAALPVGTQPNRLAAMQGNVPFLHNVDMEDPSLGFLEDYSIFDLMSAQGISWKFFESDIGTIRLYDRFRLDVGNVRPLRDLDRHLRRWRDEGSMPRVIFIEPEFLFGNDDHPPVDVRDGQDFIKHVIGRFIDFGLMNRVLFLVTYDEHGGFFDHIAPPGTISGDSAWIGNVAGMFPQEPLVEPNCMGVRVPSFAMSKFITNEAKHSVLDHTSILKTILLHNRASIATDQFSRFGDRVLRGAHFGELMDRTTARAIDYAALAGDMGYESQFSWFRSRGGTIVDAAIANLSRTHPSRVLQQIATPRPRRFVSA